MLIWSSYQGRTCLILLYRCANKTCQIEISQRKSCLCQIGFTCQNIYKRFKEFVTVKNGVITLESYSFETQLEPVVKNATLGLRLGIDQRFREMKLTEVAFF